jgi:hypothetical protein
MSYTALLVQVSGARFCHWRSWGHYDSSIMSKLLHEPTGGEEAARDPRYDGDAGFAELSQIRRTNLFACRVLSEGRIKAAVLSSL